MKYQVIEQGLWDSLPIPVPPKEKDKYEDLLADLEEGYAIAIPVTTHKEMRGLRIALGRKTKARGFQVEYRVDGMNLYVKRCTELLSERE